MSARSLGFAPPFVLAALAGCSSTPTPTPVPGPPAYGACGPTQLFTNLGSHERPVTTSSAEAQQYFDEGLAWAYAFNHDEAVRSFTRATELDPENPGPNHFYIHAVEPSTAPERAIAAADRLSDSVPGAGHFEHMPSHIYVQVGMWDEAVTCNEKAMAADARYRELSPEQGQQYMYTTHNDHMLAFAAMMSGREQEALAAARAMWADIPPDKLASFIDGWMCAKFDVLKRFGRWDVLLEEPQPPAYLPVATASWHSARAVSFAANKDFDSAREEHAAFKLLLASLPEDQKWGPDLVHTVLGVADHFITAEIALQQGDYATAATELEQGVALEDTLSYGEPPTWLRPTRHTLGAVYLADSHFEHAERVYRADLAKWPGNGWSLYGLSRALEGQGKSDEARVVRQEFDKAWEHADEPTETSCKCIPKT